MQPEDPARRLERVALEAALARAHLATLRELVSRLHVVIAEVRATLVRADAEVTPADERAQGEAKAG